MAKVTINLGGRMVEAQRMPFKPLDEPWSSYKLEDGLIVKVKLLVTDVYKLPNPDPLTGLPQVIVRSSNIMSVEPPETPMGKREVN